MKIIDVEKVGDAINVIVEDEVEGRKVTYGVGISNWNEMSEEEIISYVKEKIEEIKNTPVTVEEKEEKVDEFEGFKKKLIGREL